MSRIAATDRMARLVAVIPWIADQDGVTLDDISERFDYPRNLLLEDLSEVVFFVGVPPYTPDTLIEVIIDDDMVWIRYADWFSRPMRLSGTEILALLAAGEAALAFDTGQDAGALARGLTKLRLSTGTTAEVVDVGLGTVATPLLSTLRSASQAQRCVDIRYFSFSSNAPTDRRVEPSRLFLDAGRWYVGGYCHLAEAERVFRVDRIASATETDEVFTHVPPDTESSYGTFELDDGPEVTLSAPISSDYLFEGVPVRSIEKANDRLVVTLAVSSGRFMEQLLLRIGPEARIESGVLPIDVGDAAQRVRSRYVD